MIQADNKELDEMRTTIAIAILVTTGCAGAPVGWGGTYKVLASNPKSITIEYDGLTSSLEKVARVAESHCSSHGKSAVPDMTSSDRALGVIRAHVFRCE